MNTNEIKEKALKLWHNVVEFVKNKPISSIAYFCVFLLMLGNFLPFQDDGQTLITEENTILGVIALILEVIMIIIIAKNKKKKILIPTIIITVTLLLIIIGSMDYGVVFSIGFYLVVIGLIGEYVYAFVDDSKLAKIINKNNQSKE